jgi:hypothetical protein
VKRLAKGDILAMRKLQTICAYIPLDLQTVDFLAGAFFGHPDQVGEAQAEAVNRGQPKKVAEALSEAERGAEGSTRRDVPENVLERKNRSALIPRLRSQKKTSLHSG